MRSTSQALVILPFSAPGAAPEEPMTETILWWHWIVLGIALVVLELIVPSFTIFWFGLGAILTGLTVLFFPGASLAVQLALFTASSVACTFLWFRIFRPKISPRSHLDNESAVIGEAGIAATRAPQPGDVGRARFSVPIMGHEAWDFVSDEPIGQGERIRIVGIIVENEGEGPQQTHRILKVEKVK